MPSLSIGTGLPSIPVLQRIAGGPTPLINFDPSDLSTMFQERTEATAVTPAVVGGPVGWQRNKGSLGGGRGAPSDATRPTLVQSAGVNLLRFSSSRMNFVGTIPGPFSVLLGFKWVNSNTAYWLFNNTGAPLSFGFGCDTLRFYCSGDNLRTIGPGLPVGYVGGAAADHNVNVALFTVTDNMSNINFSQDQYGGVGPGADYDDYGVQAYALPALATRNSLIQAMITKTGAVATPLGYPLLLADGNSLTVGYLSGTSGWPSLVAAQLSKPFVNIAVSGATTADMLADFAIQVEGYGYHTSSGAALIAWEGTNDIFYGADLATCFSRWTDYFSRSVAAGWASNGKKLVAMTVIARVFDSGKEAVRVNFNNWLRANYASYATHLVDLAADSRLSDYTNTTYFNGDQTHLTAAGQGVVKDLVIATVFP